MFNHVVTTRRRVITTLTVVLLLIRGGAKRHRKILRDNIQGITKPVRVFVVQLSRVQRLTASITSHTGHPSSCSPWRCQAYLGFDLRGNTRCAQDLLGERALYVFVQFVPLFISMILYAQSGHP